MFKDGGFVSKKRAICNTVDITCEVTAEDRGNNVDSSDEKSNGSSDEVYQR